VPTAVARTSRFVEPDQCDASSPVPFAKIFPFAADPNQIHNYRCLVPQGGAYRDRHGRRERDAVDARASGASWQSQGEMNLVSDQLACETIGALADGKAVWFWHPLLVLNSRRLSRPNRADKTLIRGRR